MQKLGWGNLIYFLLCPYNPMPHGKKNQLQAILQIFDGRLHNNYFFYGLLQ